MENLDELLATLEQPLEQMTYEQALSQLEQIVAALESGSYSLEVSLRLFERGKALVGFCSEVLDKAELRVKQLSGDSLTDFELSE